MYYSNWQIVFSLVALFPLLHCQPLKGNEIQKPIYTLKHQLYARRVDEAKSSLQEQIQELKTRIKNVVRDKLRLEEIVNDMDRDMEMMLYNPQLGGYHEAWQKRNQAREVYWQRDVELQELNAELIYLKEGHSAET